MITREEYIIALDIVESYHQQLKKDIRHDFKELKELKVGDFVLCTRTWDKTKNTLTVNKRYEVVYIFNDIYSQNDLKFIIINDQGKKSGYYDNNKQFKAINNIL